MSHAGFLIAFATLAAAGIVIYWIVRADKADDKAAKPPPARRAEQEPVGDDPGSALKRAVEAGEAARGKAERDGS
jgi:hypothetical protein